MNVCRVYHCFNSDFTELKTIRPRWGRGLLDGDAGGWGEGEVGGVDGDVLLHVGEGELGDGSGGLFEAHGWMAPVEVTTRVSSLTRWAMPLGMPVMREAGAAAGVTVMLFELFGELGVAEEEAERGAQVVELFGGERWAWASPGV